MAPQEGLRKPGFEKANVQNPSANTQLELARLSMQAEAEKRPERGPEQPDWNKKITLTFDDSLRNAPEIIAHMERLGIRNFRFYGEAGTAMRPEVIKDMRLEGIMSSPKLTPGKWLTEYVDKKRGEMTREEYMRERMIKNSPAQGTDYLANGQKIREYFQKKFPDNWLQKIEETFGYHAALIHPLPRDRRNHIQYWTPAQIVEDIETYETFIRAWLKIPEFKIRHGRTPGGGGFGFDAQFSTGLWTGTGNAKKLIETLEKARPGATWDMWTTNSFDANKRGTLDAAAVAASALANTLKPQQTPYLPRENLLLLHSNKYDAANLGKLDRLNAALAAAYQKTFSEPKETPQRLGTVTAGGIKLWSQDGSPPQVLGRGETLSVLGEENDAYIVRRANGKEGRVAKKFMRAAAPDKPKEPQAEPNPERPHAPEPQTESNPLLPKTIQGKEVVYELGPWTPHKIQALIRTLQSLKTQEARMLHLYNAWKDIPYQKKLPGLRHGYEHYTAEEPYRGKIVIRLESMDCTEFPLYGAAMLGARGLDDFFARIVKFKYRNGEAGDENKIHYTYLRMRNWQEQGLMRDIAPNLPSHLVATDARSSTTIENRQEKEKTPYTYIPTSKVAAAIPFLKTGDVFGFIISDAKNSKFGRTRDGTVREQIVGHMGFIVIEKGVAYFIHSNSSRYTDGTQAGISICEYWDPFAKKMRKGTKRPLHEYLRGNTSAYKGIAVFRPVLSELES